MSENSTDLLLCLREVLKSLKFDNLLEHEFDSSDSLMALELDLPKLQTISLGQRSLFKKLITDFKRKYYDIYDKCETKFFKCYNILSEIKNNY
jgi:hypothetical protein